MNGVELRQMRVFLAVLERRSFARAAIDVGLSAPSTSQTVRSLEERLGVQLLRRTTRRVAPTAEGERLAARLAPLLAELDATLDETSGVARKVAGSLRLTVPRFALTRWVRPWLAPFAAKYPEVLLEISVDERIVDLVEQRFDAGIRLGERLAPDMVAIPLGGPLRMAAVASPTYFAKHGEPKTPRDLAAHRCINHRLQAQGGIYRWELARNGRTTALAVGGGWPGSPAGGLVVNDTDLAIAAALDHGGIAFVFDELVAEHVRRGRLVRVLEAWCPPFPGMHLYYPRRERLSPALRAFAEFVRKRNATL
jgi:DNA-binding transcriptional LysR family regulator